MSKKDILFPIDGVYNNLNLKKKKKKKNFGA